MQISFDGMTWIARQPAIGNTMFAAAWSGSEFMAVGQFGITQHSADGVNWIFEDSAIFSGDLNAVGSLSNRFIAVGSGGRIVSTP
jgi:hypothetical protein